MANVSLIMDPKAKVRLFWRLNFPGSNEISKYWGNESFTSMVTKKDVYVIIRLTNQLPRILFSQWDNETLARILRGVGLFYVFYEFFGFLSSVENTE